MGECRTSSFFQLFLVTYASPLQVGRSTNFFGDIFACGLLLCTVSFAGENLLGAAADPSVDFFPGPLDGEERRHDQKLVERCFTVTFL